MVGRIFPTEKQSRRLVLSSGLTFMARAGSAFFSVLLLPAYLRFLEGQALLGLWFTVSSVLSWFLTFDVGIGNGLRNHLVAAFATNDRDGIRKYISSAYVILGGIVVVLAVVGYSFVGAIDWNAVFRVPRNVASPAVLLVVVKIMFVGTMLQFVLRLVMSIFYALQMPYMSGVLALGSNMMVLIFLEIGRSLGWESRLVALAYVNAVSLNLPLVVATVVVFRTKLKGDTPSASFVSSEHGRRIVMLGGVFFWVQVLFMLITNTNELLISWLTGQADVVPYRIYSTMFGLVSTVFVLGLGPVWSEVTEANVRGEQAWIVSLYRRLNRLGLVAICGLLVLVLALQGLINVWLGDKAIRVDYGYALAFAVFGAVYMWNAILSSIVNGVGRLGIAAVFLTLGALVNVPLAFFLERAMGSWIAVVVANTLSLLPFCVMQTLWLRKYFESVADDSTRSYS